MEGLSQGERAAGELPERGGLGREGMLMSVGFIIHKRGSSGGIHPCGAGPRQACGFAWKWEYGATSEPGSAKHLLVPRPRAPQVSYLSGL